MSRTRVVIAAALLLASASTSCGRYGPPTRTAPRQPAAAAEQPTPDPEEDGEERDEKSEGTRAVEPTS